MLGCRTILSQSQHNPKMIYSLSAVFHFKTVLSQFQLKCLQINRTLKSFWVVHGNSIQTLCLWNHFLMMWWCQRLRRVDGMEWKGAPINNLSHGVFNNYDLGANVFKRVN
uniref:Uncharacterized protein n=1 Tax=Cucumis melo TaxID=3656 RepID=A0A9I9ELG6_CUCME